MGGRPLVSRVSRTRCHHRSRRPRSSCCATATTGPRRCSCDVTPEERSAACGSSRAAESTRRTGPSWRRPRSWPPRGEPRCARPSRKQASILRPPASCPTRTGHHRRSTRSGSPRGSSSPRHRRARSWSTAPRCTSTRGSAPRPRCVATPPASCCWPHPRGSRCTSSRRMPAPTPLSAPPRPPRRSVSRPARYGWVASLVLTWHGDAAYEDGVDRDGPRHRLWMAEDAWRYERSSR